MAETQTIGELLIKIAFAQERMGITNANRQLLGECGAAIMSLSSELHDLKTKPLEVGDVFRVDAPYVEEGVPV